MEGAPVTAATGALGPVVAKLAALLGSKYKLRRRTRKDVKVIKSKLKSVHSILWMIWGKEILDAESKKLKNEALDLAADMEDAVDDFILTMEPSRKNNNLMVQIKIQASTFQDFRARVDEVSVRCRNKWKSAQPISSLFSSKKNTNPRKSPPPRAPFVRKDASELIGLGKWRDELIRYLVGEQQEESTMVNPEIKMASIVGMAGVGKTTLARLVYEEIECKFQSRAFVSVTPTPNTPNMKEVLTSILKQVGAEPPAGTQARTEEGLIHAISNFLDDKRYLVIIDGIWHREEWEIVSNSFPQNNLGSRIVIATRIASVPGDHFGTNKLCIRMNPKCSPLSRLNPDWSKPRWLYGPDGEDVATRMKPDMVGEGFDSDHPIVRMCGGVPLALLCMFSALRMVREQQQLGVHVKACVVQDMIEKQVKQSGIQNTPGFEPLVESLQLGYDDLPHHMLKTCLLYCSIYPENYCFHMNDLVMRWVAEGFTSEVDAAKYYLEELMNRGLLIKGHIYGHYRMNPMMRNFLRWKSREDNFITCSSDITSAYAACRIHRLCIDGYLVDGGAVDVVDTLLELYWSQIRSLVVFEGAKRCVPFEKLEHVRVLDLQYHHNHLELERSCRRYSEDFVFEALGNQHVKDICGGLLRVRHLFGLEGTGISEIPPEIARLQHLETLQVRFTWITELPCEIDDLQELKSLVVSHNNKLAKLPKEIGDLQHLETLELSYNSRLTELPHEIRMLQNLENLNLHATGLKELPEEIGKLHHLKTLDLSHNFWLTRLPQEIGELHHLETLDLSDNIRLTQLPQEIGNLHHLESLDLSHNNQLTQLPREIGELHHLETLDLSHNMGLTQLPREIWKLENLKRLSLRYTAVRKIPREIGGLKKLEKLDVMISVLPWQVCQLSELEGAVPECICQAWKNSDLASELAREILSILVNGISSDLGGLIIGRKHMSIPRWIKDHFNDLASLDIRICKLEEQDLNILREMPSLRRLTLRLEVVPRKPIAINGEGFPRLKGLTIDSRMPPVVTFQEGAMPMLQSLCFDFQFYGGPPLPANNGDPLAMGIKHLWSLSSVFFRCNQEWYRGAVESSPCMSAMIDVVSKEAREHPNMIRFDVSGRRNATIPKVPMRLVFQKRREEKKRLAQEVSLSSSSGSAGADIKEEEKKQPASSAIGFLP